MQWSSKSRLPAGLLSLILIAGPAPVEFIHHLVEDHEQNVHVCDYDHCVREFTHHCELSDLESPKKQLLKPAGAGLVISLLSTRVPSLSVAYFDLLRTPCQQRGPPVVRFIRS